MDEDSRLFDDPVTRVRLHDVLSAEPGRKIVYLLQVSLYSAIMTSLAVGTVRGWELVMENIFLVILIPVIVSAPTCFMAIQRQIQIEDLMHKLQHSLAHDPLTNAKTRQVLFDSFDRRTQDRALVMVDADHFKQINDTHGHLIGDQVLRFIADSLARHLRKDDILCRFGGEEFAILLTDTEADGAMAVCNRMRSFLSETPVITAAGPVSVTVSIGLTMVGAHETVEDAIARADEALYQAKSAGRNRIELVSRPNKAALQRA